MSVPGEARFLPISFRSRKGGEREWEVCEGGGGRNADKKFSIRKRSQTRECGLIAERTQKG